MTINNLKFQRTLFVLLFVMTCCCLSAQSIALRKQRNTCVPTVYIDILDGEKDENRNLISTKDDNGNKVFKFKNNSGAYVEISDAIIADNPEIIANASSERWTTYYNSNDLYNTKEETYDLAVITIIDKSGSIKERHELTTIRGRGNSTWNSPKRAFRLKFPSKTKLLAKADGTNEYANAKSWTLIANAIDKSLIRNSLATEIGKYVGLPYNAAYKFVDLVINGQYWGSYHIGDHIQVDADRVNIDSNEGWFMEMVEYGNSKFEEEPNIKANLGNGIGNASINIKNPEVDNDNSKDPAITAIADWFNNTLAPTMNQYSSDVHSEENGMRTYVDIETLIDYVITSELTGNYDAVISNYLYKDKTDTKLKFGPIWDNDLSFGNYGETLNKHIYNTGKGWSAFGTFVQSFFGDAVFMKAYKKKWDKLNANNNIVSFINDKVSTISSSISCSWEDNSARWPLNEKLISWGGLTYDNSADYSTVLKDITEYVSAHTSWLNTEYSSWYDAMKSTAACTIDASLESTSTTPFSNFSNKITATNVINRSFVANEWQAICLPFDLDGDELKATFGTGVELAEYTLLNGTTMTFTPQDKLALHAGVPYLIKPSQAVQNPDFGDVVLSIQQPKTIRLSKTDEISFVGTFFKTTTGTGTSIISNGAVAENATDNVIGISAYIVKPAGTEVTINILNKEVAELSIDMKATDNATTMNDKLGGTYNITLANRGNLYADGWCTITLPFTITKKNFEVAIGYETKLRELSSIKGTSFEFGKVADKTMHAGVPYLIMIDNTDTSITKDLGTVVFNNTQLEATEGTSVSPQEGYAFVGILQATDLKTDGTELFLGGTGDKLLIPIPSDKRLSGGKAFFQVPSKSIGTNAKVNIDGVETTAIEALHNDIMSRNDNKVYNLNGQMVGTDIRNMPKGIYIYNGKKIIK